MQWADSTSPPSSNLSDARSQVQQSSLSASPAMQTAVHKTPALTPATALPELEGSGIRVDLSSDDQRDSVCCRLCDTHLRGQHGSFAPKEAIRRCVLLDGGSNEEALAVANAYMQEKDMWATEDAKAPSRAPVAVHSNMLDTGDSTR